MNTKRIAFWTIFVLIIGFIIWGMVVAMNKPTNLPNGQKLGEPAPVSASDNVRGPSNATVTLIEYSDFQCLACKEYYPLVARLLEESSTTVRFIYRHFPLDELLPTGQVQHPNAMPAALASEAAGVQDKFWEMYDLLFTNHADWTELPDPVFVFKDYASRLGLNATQFANDIGSSTLKEKIQSQKNEGISLSINSTPTFFVNGKAIANPQGYDQFKAIIDTAAKAGTN